MKKIITALISVLVIALCSFSALANEIETEIIPFGDDDPTPAVCTNHCDYNKNGRCDYCGRVLADVNNDGSVNLKDLLRLKKILAGVAGARTADATPDVNSDGAENTGDLTSLAKVLLEKSMH